MSGEPFRFIDVPDVPDPAQTQPPTHVDPALLGDVPKTGRPTESLYPMDLSRSGPMPTPGPSRPRWVLPLLFALIVAAVAALVSSGLLATVALLIS